jgi:hydroxymethylglutaryl-CoA reductase
MAKSVTKEVPARLSDRVDHWLEEQEERNQRADAMIEEYITGLSIPGIPLGVLRQMEIDGRARGFSHDLAMRILAVRLKP